MKQKFDPQQWLNKTSDIEPLIPHSNLPNDNPIDSIPTSNHEINDNTELVVSRIEQAMKDLTANYSDWLSLGFAFANEYGEGGRGYYHRISKFYPSYSMTNCDKQYDQCLKAKGHGITIKTFFHLAKQAGIDVRTTTIPEHHQEPRPFAPWPTYEENESEEEDQPVVLPNLPESVYAELPEFLDRVVSIAETKEERDVLLIGAITVLGACIPKMFGIYDGNMVHPNLYLFITSKASAGKGRLNYCKALAKPVHFALRKQYYQLQQEYENKLREYNVERLKDPNIEKPQKPQDKMLFIPANCSATGMFQLLSDNDGQGLIFETEGDTLALAFKSDHGNYSDGYRKGFHHESISYYRRTDHEYVEIDRPRISTVLGGTFQQIATLIPSAENGLMSRFIFYYMNIRPEWKNMFNQIKDKGMEEHFSKLGFEFFKLYEAMNESDAIQFCLSERQKEEFHVFFSHLLDKYLMLQGLDFMATVRRMGLIAFRISMILTALRILETGDFTVQQECQDVDFYAALAMVKVLIRHSSHVFTQLQEEGKTKAKKNKKELFLEGLPEKFNRKEYTDLANTLNLSAKSATAYIKIFCDKGWILHEQHDSYVNLTIEDKNASKGEFGKG
jgi:predicted transcriptional regulator